MCGGGVVSRVARLGQISPTPWLQLAAARVGGNLAQSGYPGCRPRFSVGAGWWWVVVVVVVVVGDLGGLHQHIGGLGWVHDGERDHGGRKVAGYGELASWAGGRKHIL